MTEGQRHALRELRQLAASHPAHVLDVEQLPEDSYRSPAVRVRLSMLGIERVDRGLQVADDHEDVDVVVPDTYPDQPPLIWVRHDRFAACTHVLKGRVLCIYLEPSREWHPSFGMLKVVERLREWFEDAAAARFDSRIALFHVFGGLPTATVPRPMVVVRCSPPVDEKLLSLATLRPRTAERLDLILWRAGRARSPDRNAVVLGLGKILPYGLEATLGGLVAQAAGAGGPQPLAAIEAIHRAVLASSRGEPAHIVVTVRHPDDPEVVHLAVGEIPASVADQYRSQPQADLVPRTPIGWLPMSDERPEISTRRDNARPVAPLRGKSVAVWGCGGLGSWIAELIVRAGPQRVIVCDNALVGGGLLVRQNYLEDDVGRPKAIQLGARLAAISDDVEVIPQPKSALEFLHNGALPVCDLIIDATIHETIAARLDEAARKTGGLVGPALAQVATDPKSATLGLLIFAPPGGGYGPATIDSWAAAIVRNDPELERFRTFWAAPEKRDQVVPAAGCLVPTFHGSAADLATLAGGFVNLIGQHLRSGTPGVHLMVAPTAGGAGPTHRFMLYPRT